MDNILVWIAGGLAVLAATSTLILLRRQKGLDPDDLKTGLSDLVTLDAAGWNAMRWLAAFGTIVMVGSSAAIGVDYWTGLAINADVTAGKIDPTTAGVFGFREFLTVGVVGFFFLAIVFEFFSDLGTPMASGLKQRKKAKVPELILAATVGCLFMSVVTKWGYYDDKTNVRRIENAQIVVDDDDWHTKLNEAQATIDALAGTPGPAVADAREMSIKRQLEALDLALKDARSARDALPITHSTNRAKAQAGIDDLTRRIADAENKLIDVATDQDKIAQLAAAVTARDNATNKIKETAGKVVGDGGRVRAGDLLIVRVFRVGLHQFLCWLFPLIYFESVAAYRAEKKKEVAAKLRRETYRSNRNTYDADFEEVDDGEQHQISLDDKYFSDRAESERDELERLRAEAASRPGYDSGEGGDVETEGDEDGASKES